MIGHIENKPDFTGDFGLAWRCDLPALRETVAKESGDNAQDCALGLWIVEAAWAHPIWHSYIFTLVHLRPADRPTKFYLDGATHEMWVQALDPEADRQKALNGEENPLEWGLHPLNFAAQFIEVDDALAVSRIEDVIQLVCNGRLSPDTDYIRYWAELFGGNMLKNREIL